MSDIRLTKNYRYPINRVLCVFEIKKRLTRADLADTINHLADAQKLHLDAIHENSEEKPFSSIRATIRSYERITGKIGPESYRALLDAAGRRRPPAKTTHPAADPRLAKSLAAPRKGRWQGFWFCRSPRHLGLPAAER